MGVSPLLPSRRSQGFYSGNLAWPQWALPVKPSHIRAKIDFVVINVPFSLLQRFIPEGKEKAVAGLLTALPTQREDIPHSCANPSESLKRPLSHGVSGKTNSDMSMCHEGTFVDGMPGIRRPGMIVEEGEEVQALNFKLFVAE